MNSGASNRIASTPDIHDPESSSFELAVLCGPPFFCPGFSVAKDYRVQGTAESSIRIMKITEM
jgi:hypothetical protein